MHDDGRRPRHVVVNDRMQHGYEYDLTHPSGRDLDPAFNPDLAPFEMLRLGVFGGKYMTDGRDEFPDEWFEQARLSPGGPRAELNCFGVDAGLPLEEWRRRGWLHPDDPRGWFQWYCRYWMGRRLGDEDARQIARWRAFRRHESQVRRHCARGDLSCRRRQRQALLQWAYDSRKI